MQRIRITLFLIAISFVVTAQKINPVDSLEIENICLSEEEKILYGLLMDYRKKKNLPSIALSRSLTYVAKVHAMDLHYNRPFKNKRCNMHSWSKYGDWKSCCYTADHRYSECMWYKTSELTDYTSEGYEIAFGYGNRNDYLEHGEVTPINALNGWKKSTGHNNTIINKSQWRKIEWKAIGIAIYKDFALVWFGAEIDTAEEISICK